jgi:endonuclease/exonuclease/phosphatase family metal-dependent hydrolase
MTDITLSASLSKSQDSLRVVTLNVWGQYGGWEDRRSVLIDGLRNLNPDLVAFQEALKTESYDQTVDLLGPGYHIVYQTDRNTDGTGCSIASRWPLGTVRELDLHLTPRTVDFPGAALVAEINAPEPVGTLLFANHFPNYQLDFELERELQTVAAARFIEDFVGQRNLHVILVGDLDATPAAASIRFWSGRQSLGGMSVYYRDAWESAHPNEPGYTFSQRNPLRSAVWEESRRIDYIFVRGGHKGTSLKIAACAQIFNEPVEGVWASDHFGVVADLTV